MQKLRFRYIAPGQFLMGSPEDEVGRFGRESPQHPVLISQGFWMLDTACTQGFWQALMGDNPSRFNGKDGPGGPNHPVEKVSWDDVQQFLQKLAAVLGKNGLDLLKQDCQVTLPTEAEWEYVCRAVSATAYHFGNQITPDLVNYFGKFKYDDDNAVWEFRTCAVDVVQFRANFGVYTKCMVMCGNGVRMHNGIVVQQLAMRCCLNRGWTLCWPRWPEASKVRARCAAVRGAATRVPPSGSRARRVVGTITWVFGSS